MSDTIQDQDTLQGSTDAAPVKARKTTAPAQIAETPYDAEAVSKSHADLLNARYAEAEVDEFSIPAPMLPALLVAQKALEDEAAKKTKKTGQGTSTYATLADVLDVIIPAVNEAGLVIRQFPAPRSSQEPNLISVVTVVADANSGCQFRFLTSMVAEKSNAHGMGSAITYAKRYALLAFFMLKTEDDDGAGAVSGGGGNGGSYQRQAPAAPVQAARPQPQQPAGQEYTDDDAPPARPARPVAPAGGYQPGAAARRP